MDFSWTPHRFVGGALALDVANSVVLRIDPARRIDRFAVPGQLAAFAPAAELFCAERTRFGTCLPVAADNCASFLTLREAIDGYFRACASGDPRDGLLADLLEAIAAMLRVASAAPSLEAATAHSALGLLAGSEKQRLKICGHCGWLFIDRSRNGSRLWCDMAVCGNREKASRHYRRRKEAKA